MRVKDLLKSKKSEVVTVDPHARVATAAKLLMQHTIGGLPVVGTDGQLVGFVSERDFVRAVHLRNEGIRDLEVEQIMSRPAPTCHADENLN